MHCLLTSEFSGTGMAIFDNHLSKNWPEKPFHQRSMRTKKCGRTVHRQGQDSSVGGGAGVNCLGVVHMEGVQVRVQVEAGREENGERKKHGERQNEEATRNGRSNAHHG